MTPGERSFAARLISKLENDYHCWFDVPVGKKRLRPDFIVLHPGRGILVLELKDWKLDTVRQIDQKTVELMTDRGIKHVPNPLEQARAYALEIKETLEGDPFLVEQDNP
ncbi:MAG: NERD domain-containing protein, partial [Sulfuritalea sp.]|nr:NERD domain-containing protein [Sulfuritalea sp.]